MKPSNLIMRSAVVAGVLYLGPQGAAATQEAIESKIEQCVYFGEAPSATYAQDCDTSDLEQAADKLPDLTKATDSTINFVEGQADRFNRLGAAALPGVEASDTANIKVAKVIVIFTGVFLGGSVINSALRGRRKKRY